MSLGITTDDDDVHRVLDVDGSLAATAGTDLPADAVAALVEHTAGSVTAWTDAGDGLQSTDAEDGLQPTDASGDVTINPAGATVRSAVVAPISYGDETYGHLVVLSAQPRVDAIQQPVLSQLAETAGYAIDAVETRAALERQNERLDEFASLVSHDLRNPLNVVRGRADLLAAEVDTDHVEPIRRSVTRMEQIIDDMLALARDGQLSTDLESLSLSTTAEDVWADFDPEDATLVVAGDRELQADYGALCELFENCFRNALEHAGPDVTVTVGTLDGGFYIADDGPGIPPEDRDEVFEYGYTTDSQGTGYGLPIVQHIAEAHGWSVSIRPSDTGGTRFDVTGVE